MASISIIIPIYNIKSYMYASVESVIGQTQHDLEIILVDDGSTDGSGAICDEYARKDSRIKVIHKANGGLSSARNAGAALATAEYLLFLDGDDYLHPEAVERLLKIAKKYPSDIVQFEYKEVPEVVQLPALAPPSVSARAYTAKEAFSRLYEFGGTYASGCTKLIRRQLVLEQPFEPICHEDEMWCTRVFPKNVIITYIPDILYGYVVRQGSIIHSKFNVARLDILKIKEERIKILDLLQFTDLKTLEYNLLFLTLFMLYRDAKLALKPDSQADIINYIKNTDILKRVNLKGKFRLLRYISYFSIKTALDLYYFYWKFK